VRRVWRVIVLGLSFSLAGLLTAGLLTVLSPMGPLPKWPPSRWRNGTICICGVPGHGPSVEIYLDDALVAVAVTHPDSSAIGGYYERAILDPSGTTVLKVLSGFPLEVVEGSYDLRVQREGHVVYHDTINVQPGRETFLQIGPHPVAEGVRERPEEDSTAGPP
jgi:hypothetical protein